MTTSPDLRIPQQVWDQVIVAICQAKGVDPYVIAAIGAHETGQGTLGDGRMPPLGSGHILGVGSYDSGSTSQWAGWGPQVQVGCNTLIANGVRTIDDIRAGKLHATPGHIPWASADTGPGYSWSTAVVAIWDGYHHDTPNPTPGPAPTHSLENDMIVTTRSPGGDYLVTGGRKVHLQAGEKAALVAAGVPAVALSDATIDAIPDA